MTGQRAEQSRFSTAGRPQDADELLRCDLKGDVLQHLKAGASLTKMALPPFAWTERVGADV
jgi:hypothetical protein